MGESNGSSMRSSPENRSPRKRGIVFFWSEGLAGASRVSLNKLVCKKRESTRNVQLGDSFSLSVILLCCVR